MRRYVKAEVVLYREGGRPYTWTGETRTLCANGEPLGNWGVLYGTLSWKGNRVKGWTSSQYPPDHYPDPNSVRQVIMISEAA